MIEERILAFEKETMVECEVQREKDEVNSTGDERVMRYRISFETLRSKFSRNIGTDGEMNMSSLPHPRT